MAWERVRAMANPSVQSGRRIGAQSWPAAVQGGPGSPACRMLAPRGRYGLRYLAKKDQGVGVVLTMPGIGRGSGTAVPAVRSHGGTWAAFGRSSRRRCCSGVLGVLAPRFDSWWTWARGVATAQLWRGWEAAERCGHGGGVICSERRSCGRLG